jgi:hypothetical protein
MPPQHRIDGRRAHPPGWASSDPSNPEVRVGLAGSGRGPLGWPGECAYRRQSVAVHRRGVESPWLTDEHVSRLEQLELFLRHRGPELFTLVDAAGETLDAWAGLSDWLTAADRRDVGRDVEVIEAVADLAYIWRALLEPFEQLTGTVTTT